MFHKGGPLKTRTFSRNHVPMCQRMSLLIAKSGHNSPTFLLLAPQMTMGYLALRHAEL